MSANDNPMTRFLFAILQQQDLKATNWNKVACDPILAKEISNGHAARMRYSRFRSAMLGIEPQRRNRANTNRSRVSKKKDDSKGGNKKDEASQTSSSGVKSKTSGSIKHERDTPDRAETPSSMILSPNLKEERIVSTSAPASDCQSQLSQPHHQALTGFANSGLMSDLQFRQRNMRLLTPCSDSDVLTATSQGFAHHSPASSDMLHSDAATSFSDICRESPHHYHTTVTTTAVSDPIAAWSQQTAAAAIAVATHQQHQQQVGYGGGFGFGATVGYGAGGEEPFSAFCDSPVDAHHHHHHHHHHHSGTVVLNELDVNDMLEHEDNYVNVKHEEWDAQSFP